MREIEFRCWDSFNNCMIYSSNHNMLIPGIVGFFDMYESLVKHGNDPSLMQYTGLKDSQGNKIFEGDILNVDNSNAIVEVAWIDDGWCVFDEKLNTEAWLEKDYEPYKAG